MKTPPRWLMKGACLDCRTPVGIRNTTGVCYDCRKLREAARPKGYQVANQLGVCKYCAKKVRNVSGHIYLKHTFRGRSRNRYSGYREDIGIFVRSRWEANVARVLQYLSIPFTYETTKFDFGNGFTYIPDFEIHDKLFVEVKGWKDKWSRRKLAWMHRYFPEIEIWLVDGVEYLGLTTLYKSSILRWE